MCIRDSSYTGGNAAQAATELGNLKASELELVLYTKTSMGDGTQAVSYTHLDVYKRQIKT